MLDRGDRASQGRVVGGVGVGVGLLRAAGGLGTQKGCQSSGCSRVPLVAVKQQQGGGGGAAQCVTAVLSQTAVDACGCTTSCKPAVGGVAGWVTHGSGEFPVSFQKVLHT